MSFKRPWLSLLALLPLVGMAQSVPHLYVGASAVLMHFAPFEPYANSHLGPAATVGLQFSPRWAFETGAQLTWHTNTSTYIASVSSGVYDYVTVTMHSSALVVPLMARYTFSQPAARLRVDALGGVSWLHGTSRVDYTSGPSGYVYQTSNPTGVSNAVGIVLGPQLRYSLGGALEAKLNLPLNLNVTGGDSYFSERLFLSPQLGLQYAFNH